MQLRDWRLQVARQNDVRSRGGSVRDPADPVGTLGSALNWDFN